MDYNRKAPEKGQAKTDKERQKSKNQRKRDMGLKLVQCWVLPEDEPALKEIERSSQEKAKAV